VTISIGVAASPEHGDEAESLIDTADRAMYRAKAAGEGIALGDPPGTQGVTAEEATT
jgi:diguanylate cyclase (GGDEF)-like protein